MKRYEIMIKGKVQGIGYRNFVRLKASRLNIKGFVKNIGSDSVEIVAEGNEIELNKFKQEVHRGPINAHIKEFNLKEKKTTGEFSSFEIEFE